MIKPCEGCGSVIYPLKEYRGQSLCAQCIQDWKKLEKLLGKEVNFRHFKKGILEDGERS